MEEQEEIIEYNDDSIELESDEQESDSEGNENSESNEDNEYVPLSSWAYENLGWDNVPDNPYEALVKMKEGYESFIAELQQQDNNGYEDNQEDELHSAYKEFTTLSKEEAVFQDLLENGYSEEEAQEEVNDLMADGKLDKEYRKVKASITRDYQEAIHSLRETFEQRQAQAEREQQLETQRQQLEIKKSINSLESEHFEITKRDKQFLEDFYFKPTKNNTTLFQELLNDIPTLSELILTHLKVDEIKGNKANLKKQIATQMVNGMAKEPLFNVKTNKVKVKSIFED